MTTYLSQKLKVMSFLLIIGVMYIHSGFHDYANEIQEMRFNFALQDAVDYLFGKGCRVPIFYAISGFLFFHGVRFDGTWSEAYSPLWRKMGRRVRSLVVPYLIACWFPVLFFVVLKQIPASAAFINGEGLTSVLSLPLPQVLWQVYCDSGTGSPIAFQLYFMRDLICVVVLMPALFVFLKKVNWGGYILTALFFILHTFWLDEFWLAKALYWFFFGAYCLEAVGRLRGWWLPIVYLLICVAQQFVPWLKSPYLGVAVSTLGIMAYWVLYDRLVPKTFDLTRHAWLMTACSFTFFIYLYHEPTINIVRKLLVIPLGHTSLSFALAYLLSPWLFALIWVTIGTAMRKIVPKFYSLITGSR